MGIAVKNIFRKWLKLNNKGVTLVELVCAIAIIGVLSISVASIMIVSSKTYAKGSIEVELQQETQLLSNQIERLVQFASEASIGADSSELVIKQASSGKTYTLTYDSSLKEVNYTDGDTGTTAVLASSIESVSYSVPNFEKDGIVIMYVVAQKGDSKFAGNYTISSRNIYKNNEIPSGDISMTITEAYVVEPNQTQPLTALMSDGSGINWGMTGNTDATTVLRLDPGTGKTTLLVGTNETANIIYLTATSAKKMPDGSTPMIEKTVSVFVRRVSDVELDFINDTTGNKTKTGRNGDQYTITAKGIGTNLENKAPAMDDPGYVNEDGTDGIYKTVSPEDVVWNIDVIKSGHSVYDDVTHKGKDLCGNYSDSYIDVVPVDTIYTAGGPSLKLRLKFNLSSGDQIMVTAKAKHPLGGTTRVNSYGVTVEEQTNLVGANYDNAQATWILYRDVYRYNGQGFTRASDEAQGDIYVDNIINILRAYYGNDRVTAEAWNSDSIMRSHRFREVEVDEDGNIVSTGMWTNWRYLGRSPEQDRGNSLNMRPAASASLECDKSYQVQLRLFVLDSAGNEVYPIPGVTEESEYIVEGIVHPVSITLNATYGGWPGTRLFNASTGGSADTPAGVEIKVSRDNVKYIKNDTDKMYLSFQLQRQADDGTWYDVSTFSDYNNFNDPDSVYLRINGSLAKTDGIDTIAFHHAGTYRLLMSHVDVPYTRYNPGSDKYVEAGKRSYQYYNEATGKGVYYFNVNENSQQWKSKFIEFEGNYYSANDYFVCNNRLHKKSDYQKKDAWNGYSQELMYYTQSGNGGEMYVATNGVDFVYYTYSYKGSDPKNFTVNGTTYYDKNGLNYSGLPEVVKNLAKEKLGWW